VKLGGAEGARIHRWWKPISRLRSGEGEHVADTGRLPVPFRKVVPVALQDGQIVTVNAQQYVVLAYDVPPPPTNR
jgi:hypothetical protein